LHGQRRETTGRTGGALELAPAAVSRNRERFATASDKRLFFINHIGVI